ncbi:hypothetical protein I553_3563, partial [Mycobacterium xenopi 4042]
MSTVAQPPRRRSPARVTSPPSRRLLDPLSSRCWQPSSAARVPVARRCGSTRGRRSGRREPFPLGTVALLGRIDAVHGLYYL